MQDSLPYWLSKGYVIVKVIVTKNDVRITRKKVKAAIIKTV